ncbi:DUF2309 domain-containing protein [Thiocapsa roseopersicina]|uniref:Probable inorganic carbon transporter subunit DabA n=1 Tax=Thiocapsa roseopersicina TaxID=1058 RepID=A0A1H2VQZ2_THIRO|nr:DUF2309 domain-containing protein [Thiocapsa roseopersicina]SDW70249.1 hypothetical protein SAMN05421783_107114 [Thiocapsa roseopersicina]
MKMLDKALIGVRWTLYDLVDRLYGTRINATLNELQIKGCMDFLDEGQSVWRMPGRRQGMFRAWSHIAKRNSRLRLHGLDVGGILAQADQPEAAIDLVMTRLQIPERLWMDYFALELSKLHGWAGFVRWRAQAKDYYWQDRNPADLVDFIAIRLVLSLPLIEEAAKQHQRDFSYPAWVRCLEERPHECLLRHELHSGAILPDYAHRVEVALDSSDAGRIKTLSQDYAREKTAREAATRALRLQELCERAGIPRAELAGKRSGALRQMIDAVYAFRSHEGFVWTQALERTYIRALLAKLAKHRGATADPSAADPSARAVPTEPRRDGSDIQALFCIDVRSERLRRQLEQLGHYETFGVAGFFGVPVNFIELGKGHEAALCPAIVTPNNVALEMPHRHAGHGHEGHSLFHLATEVVHDLKSTVLAPYITVEAVGLLFGFDMVGKTLAPAAYNTWRRTLDNGKQPTRLMIDKISRDDALDLIATLQDEMVVRAVDRHFGVKREAITTGMIRELREIALGQAHAPSDFARRFDLDAAAETLFLTSLRLEYGLNPDQAKIQLEHLARIGFRIERQALLVGNLLKTIGLVEGFAKIVLVVGHGSSSQNNPYESALDCGACGGDRGLVNARIFAAMANRREVRDRLAERGIRIPEETWFIPALHDTTTDETSLYDIDQLPPGRLTQLTRIQEDLAAAGRLCARERCVDMGETGVDSSEAAARRVKRHAMDWTQVRPEWGLSKNASFIIGSRALTRALDLEGRAFLHSYDHRQDPSGELLVGILSGPLIVAQWINMEHYFSAVDNEVFGSGSKIYHNVVGRFGVMTGNVGDLRTGLPAQTVLKGDRPYHQPMRLITLIEAPLSSVRDALARVYKVRNLVENDWVRLLVLDPVTDCVSLFEHGRWSAQSWPPGADRRTKAQRPVGAKPARRPRKRVATLETSP